MSVPKPRILLLLHTLSLTGAPKVALDAFEGLQQKADIRVVSLGSGPLQDRCRQIGPLQILTEPCGSMPWTVAMRKASKIAGNLTLQFWKPDLIYVNSIVSLSAVKWLSLPDVPVILHVHELDAILDTHLGDNLHRLQSWPQKFIAVSSPVRQMLVERFGVSQDKISLVHEFIRDDDFNQFQPQEKTGHQGADAPFIVGGAGQPGWRKGTTLWLQTAAEMKRIMADGSFRFVWVGVGEDDNSVAFRHEAGKLNVSSVIDFVPVTKKPLIEFKCFDVFAMTSWEDPCPIVVLENMMLEKPVVCFAGGGGAPDEVGNTGIIVENFDPLAMAKAIADLAHAPEQRMALGKSARERVKNNFIASVQVPKIWAEIQTLLGVVPESTPYSSSDKAITHA